MTLMKVEGFVGASKKAPPSASSPPTRLALSDE
jgi:hypothetical protein